MDEERSRQIIEAARRTMADFGVRRVTVGDVATAAGLSRQTLYEYFPSKQALVQAALMAGATDVVARGRSAADEAGGSPQQRLATLIRLAMGFFATSPLWATTAKRAELAGFVALEGGVFLGAGTAELAATLTGWWPHVEKDRVARAADSLARLLVSHGLAPEGSDGERAASELAQLVATGLEG